jgi:hypothetical protein
VNQLKGKISLSKLLGFFWELENEFDLIHYEINSVKIWQYQRFRILLTLARQVSLYEHAHTKKVSFAELLNAAPSLLFYSLFSNPLSGNYQKDILVFSAGRKVKVDDKFIDIYSEYLVDKLPENSFEIIEELYLNKHLPGDRKNRKHQDYQQVLTTVKSKFSRFKLTHSQVSFANKIEKRIKDELNADINLKKLFRNGVLNFKYDFQFYNQLIKKRKPKQIYLVCSYGYKLALIAAAKKNGVETIELQHGTMNKFHAGYSFPGYSSIDYFPDKIFFFGEYWKNCMEFPIQEQNKVVYGFPYFQRQKEKYKGIKKKKGSVLIISQGTIGKKLSSFLWQCAGFFENHQVSYKLHPGEYDRWKAEYPDLVRFSKMKNVKVVDDSQTNIYDFFAESEYVIGVYSTAVYEALSFNCKVMLVDLPGVEYLEDLIDQDFVKLLKTGEDLVKQLKTGDFKKFDSKMFFA